MIESPPHARGSRVEPEQSRRELGDAGARARREGRGIERAQRSHLPHADEALVALQHDDRRVRPVLGLSPADVRPVAERLELAIGGDPDDAHACKATGVLIVTWNVNSPEVRLPRVLELLAQHLGMRIDHALLTPDLGDRLVACDIARDFRKGSKPSDHAPLAADLSDAGTA